MTEDEFQGALDGARRGDERAFASIWTEFHPRLLRVTQSLAGPGDADDIASSVWVDVVRSIDDFAGDADGFRAWLFTWRGDGSSTSADGRPADRRWWSTGS